MVNTSGETEDEWISRTSYLEWEDRWYLDFTEDGWEQDADEQAVTELLSGYALPCQDQHLPS